MSDHWQSLTLKTHGLAVYLDLVSSKSSNRDLILVKVMRVIFYLDNFVLFMIFLLYLGLDI